MVVTVCSKIKSEKSSGYPLFKIHSKKFQLGHQFCSKFKVTVSITNNITAAANAVVLSEQNVLNVLDIFDVNFDVEELLDLESLLADLGMGLTDLDPSLLDTE